MILQSSDEVPHGKAYVGKELSDVAQILEGDEISLLSVWRLEGMPLKVEASEFFESGVYEVDKLLVKVNRGDLEQWLGLSSAVTRIAIQLKNPQEAELLQAAFSQSVGVPLKTWKQVDQSYWYSLKLEKFAMGISMFFVIALASLSVNMAVSARVVEKSREISLLRSMGMSARRIFIVYLSQGAVIGLTSSVAAALLAYPVGEWVSHSYKLPPIFYVNDLPVSWNFHSIVALCLLSTLLSVWASWKPARRAMKTSISSGLRI